MVKKMMPKAPKGLMPPKPASKKQIEKGRKANVKPGGMPMKGTMK